MNFLDNIKSRLAQGSSAQNDEEQFQRGIREGSWPEGVEDFQLMDNTGTFLPATPDVDPYAEYGMDDENFSVVRAAGASRSENRLRVVEGNQGRSQSEGRLAYNPFENEGVQVVDREESRAPRSKPAAQPQKSYADRLRERVEGADIVYEQGFGPVPSAVRNHSNENASSDEIEGELASRRARRDSSRPASEPAPVAERHRESAVLPAMSADALIVRARSYDDVRSVAAGLLNEHRPVAISTRACSDANAQRLLDFSFGLCCATGAAMQELGPKLYAIVPRGASISEATMVELKRNGLLR